MARDTYDRLMAHPTWPTEWAPHMVFIAYADWMQTGDAEWLHPRYEALKSKLLIERAGEDGLIQSNKEQQKKSTSSIGRRANMTDTSFARSTRW